MTLTLTRTFDAHRLIAQRGEKRLEGWAYKLAPSGQYALDVSFSDRLEFDEKRMGVRIPYADGNRRDGVGDLLEIGGIDCERHQKNPIVLLDHGKGQHKFAAWPIAMAQDPDSGAYTNLLDPISKTGKLWAYFYQGRGLPRTIGADDEYEFAKYCEQIYDLCTKKFIRGGSIGYQIKRASQLPPDYTTGTPQGMHLQSVLMLEGSLVFLPANMDTVGKGFNSAREILSLPSCCGMPLSKYLVKSLTPYAGEKPARMGYEKREGKKHMDCGCGCGGGCGCQIGPKTGAARKHEAELENTVKAIPLQQTNKFRGTSKVPLNEDLSVTKIPPPEARPGWITQKKLGKKKFPMRKEQENYRSLGTADSPKFRTKSQPSDNISSAKACKILEDGEANGHPLTEAQRGMFGAACGRKEKYLKKLKALTARMESKGIGSKIAGAVRGAIAGAAIGSAGVHIGGALTGTQPHVAHYAEGAGKAAIAGAAAGYANAKRKRGSSSGAATTQQTPAAGSPPKPKKPTTQLMISPTRGSGKTQLATGKSLGESESSATADMDTMGAVDEKMARSSTTFKPGPNPNRHVFTQEQRKRGYQTLMEGGKPGTDAKKVAWAWRKVRQYYKDKKKVDQAPTPEEAPKKTGTKSLDTTIKAMSWLESGNGGDLVKPPKYALDAQTKALEDLKLIRQKYRKAKTRMHRVRKGSPTTGMIYVQEKDMNDFRKASGERGLKCELIGAKNGHAKYRVTGGDDGYTSIVERFGQKIK